jgi:hypothetical protein
MLSLRRVRSSIGTRRLISRLTSSTSMEPLFLRALSNLDPLHVVYRCVSRHAALRPLAKSHLQLGVTALLHSRWGLGRCLHTHISLPSRQLSISHRRTLSLSFLQPKAMEDSSQNITSLLHHPSAPTSSSHLGHKVLDGSASSYLTITLCWSKATRLKVCLRRA